MSESGDESGLRILCATWNVNGSRVGLDSLAPWLCPSSSALPPHIVAVALQELVDLKDLKNYVNDEESKFQLEDWGESIALCLKDRFKGTSYSVIKRVALVGTGLVVICQTHLLRYLRDIKRAKVATGTFGVLGNKGGCALRFRLVNCGEPDGVSFCFIAVHLAAHQHEVQRRNQDWEAILAKLNFSEDGFQTRPSHSSLGQPIVASSSVGEKRTKPAGERASMTVAGLGEDEAGRYALDHDVVFLMGDLNYRIDMDDQVTVLDLIRKRQLDVLLRKDQLINEMRNERIGRGFTEASEITFPPTYKFQPGTSKYDTRAEKKRRIPSWCDRILFRNSLAGKAKNIRCDKYRACTSLVSSDHKPVAADFTCEFLTVPVRPSSPRASTLRPPPAPPAAIKPDESLSQFAVATSIVNNGDFALNPGDRVEVLSILDGGSTILGYSTDSNKIGFCPANALRPIGVFQSRATTDVIELAAVLLEGRLHAQNKKVEDMPDLMVFEDDTLPSTQQQQQQRATLVQFPDDEDEDDDGDHVIADSGAGWYRAAVGFAARKDDEISFRNGEMVEILSKDSGIDGWWIGRARNFDQGLVPAFCFHPAESFHKGNVESASPSHHELPRSMSFEFQPHQVNHGH